MSAKYDRVCRLCLSSRGELLPIFPITSTDDTEPPVLASKIKDCVSVHITENDDLPTNICKKCMDNVNNWHIFKHVCERTQNKLCSLIKKDGSLLEEVKIKSEPLSDGAYDDGVVIDGSYADSEVVATTSKLQPEGPPILASLGLTPRSDKKYVDPRMDWQRVHAIMGIVGEDKFIDSIISTEKENVVNESDHNSDTDTELKSDSDYDYLDDEIYYTCKNNKYVLKNPKSPSAIEEPMKLKKGKAARREVCLTPRNAWQFIFCDDLLELVVSATNKRISEYVEERPSTSIGEITKLIGILYLHGVTRPSHQKCSDLWNVHYGIACVKKAMNYDRFKFLLEHLSFFDDEDTSIVQLDTMKRMRKVFEIFALNCRTAFAVNEIAVIDEIIVPVYGPCPFKYAIEKKPLKSGLKLVLVVDPSNFYVSNLDVITDPYFSGEEIVTKLVQHLAGSGKKILMDSWFTSVTLIQKLKYEYQLFSIAALNSDSEILPPLFLLKKRKDAQFLNCFVDSEISITSYISPESKSVNVITNDPIFYQKTVRYTSSPVSAYKKSQSAVEIVDVLLHYYTTMQHSKDWTLSLFFTLLNITSINTQVIWTSQQATDAMHRRLFIKELAISLIGNDQDCTSDNSDSYLNVPSVMKKRKFSSLKHRRQCRICSVKMKRKNRSCKQVCEKCGHPMCEEHMMCYCLTCVGGHSE